MSSLPSSQKAAVTGLVIGLIFGLVTVLLGFGIAVFVLFCGGLGALLGWVIYGLATGRLDLGAAWRAMRNRGDTGRTQ